MAKVFIDEYYELIPATRDYEGLKVEYKVAYGREKWHDGKRRYVYKVQMVYNDKVNGRQAPSFPVGTDDFERVQAAIARLISKFGN